jgi:hypothetical protein
LAFIGDSYVFGQGVFPEQTLPARTQRHLNETTDGLAVETINLGGNGYNTWNTWLSFKRCVQIFDGVVVTLCSNDAQLFGRTLQLDYGNVATELWEPDHPFHDTLKFCFDDIANFCASNTLPAMVCFYNLWEGRALARVSEVIGALCSERAIPFVDFFAHFAARQIPLRELHVSEPELHPSALAHDAAARHLARRIRDLGWLPASDQPSLRAVADGIISATKEMVGVDQYPRDVALRWASETLESKSRAARRQAAAAGVDAPQPDNVDEQSDRLAQAREIWSSEFRAVALALGSHLPELGFASLVERIEEEVLRIEEPLLVLQSGDWSRIAAALPPPRPGVILTSEKFDPAAIRAGIAGAAGELDAMIEMRDELRRRHESAWLQVDADLARYTASLDADIGFAEAARDGATQLLTLLERCEPFLDASGEQMPQRRAIERIRASFSDATRCLDLISKRLAAPLRPAEVTDYTTVEISLTTKAIEGRHTCFVEAQTNSLSPRRVPLKDQCQFFCDGLEQTFVFRFPVFFLGQVIVTIRVPAVFSDEEPARLVAVALYNSSSAPRRVISQATFVRDDYGRLVSPQFYLG